jgi:Cd2+/Zn2+-exporting ATPase
LENKLYKKCVPVHEKVSALLPNTVSVLTEEGTEQREIDDVLPGEIILVAAGERIPLDGVITEGITTIDTALISGQRSPWAVNVGYRVYAGCRNLTSNIKIRVSRSAEQSTGSRIVRVARNAEDFPSQQESLVSTVVKLYTPAILLLAVIIGFVVPVFRGGWQEHLRRASVLMLVSRPASVLLCLPLLYQKALALAGGIGVFVKGKDCLEAMAKTETLVFDKTGTITEGRFTVTDVFPVNMSEKQLLTIAAAAESFSRHPIAVAIREAVGRLDERIVKSVRIREIPGRGISAIVGSRRVFVGNAALLEDNGLRFEIPSRPGVAVHVAVDGQYCGHILVADKVRRRAFDALETLRINGVKKLVLLTGDVLSVARPVASRLNFDMLRSEQTPPDKAKAVAYLMKNKGSRATIAVVGDGENSGKLLTGADVGIAMGSLGSDSAFACADVMIMDKDIFKIPKMLIYSRTAYRIAWENAALSAGVALLFVALGLFNMTSPLVTEIAHFILGILLLFNTLRLK